MDFDQSHNNLLKHGSRTIRSHKIINSIWDKEELPCGVEGVDHSKPIYKKGEKQTVVTIETYYLCQLHTKFYPTSCSPG